MARRMSTIFLIFMIVPIVAPTIGQMVLLFAGWRVIFDLMAFMAVAASIWVYVRLPETLAPENVIPIQPHALAKAWKVVVLNRNSAGYMIGLASRRAPCLAILTARSRCLIGYSMPRISSPLALP